MTDKQLMLDTQWCILKMDIKEAVKIYDTVYTKKLPTLKKAGVKIVKRPDAISNKISQSTFALMFLIKHKGQIVSKEELTKAYVKCTKKYTNDLQSARHLGTQMGYDITNSRGGINGYRLNSLRVKPGFLPARRNVEMTNSEWINLKETYQFKCATCGDLEGHTARYDSSKIVKLAMGHMNPNKSLTLDNTIPQCEECNSIYKDNYIFDMKGRIIAPNK